MREKFFLAVEVLVLLGGVAVASYADSALVGTCVVLAGTAIVAIVRYFVTGPRR